MRSRRRVRDGARTLETSETTGGSQTGHERSRSIKIDRFANLWALGLSRSNEANRLELGWRLNGVERITD